MRLSSPKIPRSFARNATTFAQARKTWNSKIEQEIAMVKTSTDRLRVLTE